MSDVVSIQTSEGRTVCAHCERAESMPARMRGLLGRDGLAEGHGILLNPAPSVHTFFMRFPIDVVFVDKSRTIVKVVHDLQPWRAAFGRKAVAALELPAGAAARLDLSPGMSLVLGDRGERQSA